MDAGKVLNTTFKGAAETFPPRAAEKQGDDKSPAEEIRDSVVKTSREWQHQGKKLGTLAAASAGTLAIPLGAALLAPAMAAVILGPVGLIVGMVGIALEERHIGLGKMAGGLAGAAAGAGAGLVKGLAHQVFQGKGDPEEGKIALEKKAPTGAGPREPLFQKLLHKAEKKLFGKVPERTRETEIGESVAAFLAGGAAGVIVPAVAASLIGGPIGLVMSTLVGSLIGIVAGGAEENALGIGRTLGEATGTLIGKIRERLGGKKHPGASEQVKPQAVPSTPPAQHTAKKGLGKVLTESMQLISEPMVSFLIDASLISNRLFEEKPVQTMHFNSRPAPEVNRERLTDNFVRLTGIGGTPGSEDEIGGEVCRQLSSLGIPYKKTENGNIIATIPGTVKDAPTVLLSAHLDTVAATKAEAIRRDKETIFTDEHHILGADDRAGVAEIIEGVRSVLEKGAEHPEVKLVFTVQEESGLKGSTSLRQEEITSRPTLGFVVDSTDRRRLNLTNDSVITNPSSVKYSFSQEDPLVQVALRSMAEGGTLPRPTHAPIMMGAGSDANSDTFNSGLIRSLAIGTGGNDVHSPLENIRIDDMEKVARSVAGFITNSCDLRVDEKGDIVPRQAFSGT